MSIEAIQQELSALDPKSQRRVLAFLVSLQDAREAGYQHKLAEKISRPASEFATLEELDGRLGLGQTDDGQ